MKRTWVSGVLAAMMVLGLVACDPAGGTDVTAYHLYAAIYGNNDVDEVGAYSIDAGGVLTEITSDNLTRYSYPHGIAISPNGSYLYVATNNNTVSAYGIGAGGALTPIGSSFTNGTGPWWIAISPDSRYLYVTNSGSTGSTGLTVFSISAGGALSAIRSYSTGNMPMGIAISPNGDFLYVTNGSSSGPSGLSAYSIGEGGALTYIYSGTLATGSAPRGIAISPDGSYLYVANAGSADGSNGLSAYSIGDGGALAAIANYTTGINPYGIAISPDSHYLYVTNSGSNTLSAYTIDNGSGALSPIDGTFTTGTGPREGIVVSPDGGYLYVANYSDNGTNGISAYSIGAGGAPTAIATYSSGPDPYGIAICPVKK